MIFFPPVCLHRLSCAPICFFSFIGCSLCNRKFQENFLLHKKHPSVKGRVHCIRYTTSYEALRDFSGKAVLCNGRRPSASTGIFRSGCSLEGIFEIRLLLPASTCPGSLGISTASYCLRHRLCPEIIGLLPAFCQAVFLSILLLSTPCLSSFTPFTRAKPKEHTIQYLVFLMQINYLRQFHLTSYNKINMSVLCTVKGGTTYEQPI